jgi:GT2 family glycosyltransferase
VGTEPAGGPGASPRVLIVIVNWNGREDLAACLRSLRGVLRPAREIVVVDNASTDGSGEMVRGEFPEVTLLESGSNLLFAGGNNLALEWGLERGFDIFLLLNNDTEVEADFLERLVEAAERHPAAGIFGPRIHYLEPRDLIWYAGGEVNLWTGTVRHRGLRRRDAEWEDAPGPTGYVTGCALLVRSAVLREVGLLDPGYHMYAEDVDLCLRARRAGHGCRYEPRSRVYHRISASSGGGLSPYKVYHRAASALRLFRIHASPLQWITVPPVQGLLALGFLARQILGGRGGTARAMLRGLVDGVRGRRRSGPEA